MVHKPKHMVHSFRGLLGSGGQDEINLERSNLNLAYRVIKFSLMTNTPGTTDHGEHVVKIYREKQSSATGTVDFNDVDLLAAGVAVNRTDLSQSLESADIIFDNTLFSRNIFVTHLESINGLACNYYIELEEVPVSSATLMQLKLQVARKLSLSENPPDA